MNRKTLLAALASLAALSGCVSFGGGDPPDQLLTLTPSASVAAGTGADGAVANALSVQVPSVTQRLNVTRIPVTTSDSSLAYLADAFWVEKPAQLFRNVLSETIRARGNRLVVSGGELEFAARTQLSGALVEMGYDATRGGVVLVYDAVLELPEGTVRTRRFEARIAGVPAEAGAVGAALNQAANTVAGEVADWVG